MNRATSGHGGLTASSGKGKMDRPVRRVLRIKDNGWVHGQKGKTKKESAAMNVTGTQEYGTWCATAALSPQTRLCWIYGL